MGVDDPVAQGHTHHQKPKLLLSQAGGAGHDNEWANGDAHQQRALPALDREQANLQHLLNLMEEIRGDLTEERMSAWCGGLW